MQRFQQISISMAVPSQNVDTLIKNFFIANPSPTDEQVHALAESLGITPERLEERIYRMFSALLKGN